MKSAKTWALWVLVVSGAALIGAHFLMTEVPKWLFAATFGPMAASGLYLKFLPIYMDIRRASQRDPAQGRQMLIMYVVGFLVIGIGGYFFITS